MPRPPERNRILAVAVLLAMGVHTYLKWRWGTLPELLWACNVASFVILLGLWFELPLAVATGFLWHVAVGEPGYVLGVLQTGHTTWVSVLVHSLPALAAFLSLRRTGLPRAAPFLAFLLFVALVPISHHLTPAGLNINLAHQRLEVLQAHVPGTWSYRLVFSTLLLSLLLLADALFARALGRPTPPSPRRA